MLFALRDLADFRTRNGRYAPFVSDKFETFCFYISIPDNEISELQVGDMLLMGDYTNLISWAVMYCTDSNFSHCASYIGNRTVRHITTGGFSEDTLDSLFGSGMTFLPMRVLDKNGRAVDTSSELERFRGQNKYNWKQVIKMGIGYLSFIDPKNYRWSHYFDIMYILFTVSLLSLCIFGNFSIFIYSSIICIILLLYRIICIKKFGNPMFDLTPESIVRAAKSGYHIEPILNERGFVNYMMPIAEYIRALNIDNRYDIRTIKIPASLRLKM